MFAYLGNFLRLGTKIPWNPRSWHLSLRQQAWVCCCLHWAEWPLPLKTGFPWHFPQSPVLVLISHTFGWSAEPPPFYLRRCCPAVLELFSRSSEPMLIKCRENVIKTKERYISKVINKDFTCIAAPLKKETRHSQPSGERLLLGHYWVWILYWGGGGWFCGLIVWLCSLKGLGLLLSLSQTNLFEGHVWIQSSTYCLSFPRYLH